MSEIKKDIIDVPVDEKVNPIEANDSADGSFKPLDSDKKEETVSLTEDGDEATMEDLKTLRHVSGKIPLRVWLVAIVELAERFSYYGLSTPFQNYMQNGPEDTPKGLLKLGSQAATALSYFFQFWCYVTPILGAYISDSYLGKYKTICMACGIYIAGIFILFMGSIPSITTRNAAIGTYVAAIIIIGIATGFIKSNVSPLIADQIPKEKPTIRVLKSGERVVVDPAITIQNVFMIFYAMINIGSFSIAATTQLEHRVGFWAAFLLPFCFFFVGVFALVIGKNQYVKLPVSDKIVAKCFKVAYIGIKNRFNLDSAKPSNNPEKNYNWTDHFVEEVKRATKACKVFVFFIVFWTVYGQMTNNFVSMAGQMETHAMPNDMLQVFNSLAIVIAVPLCDRLIYPFIRRFTPLKSMTRIFIGFMFSASAMVYAAVLQHYIYKAGPCYDAPMACAPEYSNTPNRVHVAIQAPAYVLIGLSEIFANITGLEYAYTKAPISMKAFVTSLYLLTTAFGSAIGIALASVSVDPKYVWLYTGLAVATFISGCIFWILFHHYNDHEEELNQLEYDQTDNVAKDVFPGEGLAPIASVSKSIRSVV
ncbi:peptide transporter Ptr2p [[Candida] jaroonii]|uniref:Peptide transporter Ptr2p n=1 Tax=[Candida] jaroonii TaxID=467808 RepID=A0ACA9YDC5_9ASCO|nr:peptide transporter Ptr2p [[Candida] jaroonii]